MAESLTRRTAASLFGVIQFHQELTIHLRLTDKNKQDYKACNFIGSQPVSANRAGVSVAGTVREKVVVVGSLVCSLLSRLQFVVLHSLAI